MPRFAVLDVVRAFGLLSGDLEPPYDSTRRNSRSTIVVKGVAGRHQWLYRHRAASEMRPALLFETRITFRSPGNVRCRTSAPNGRHTHNIPDATTIPSD